MKIALLGYGKMGQLIEKEAALQNHEIVLRLNSQNKNWDAIVDADICIDFSHADLVLKNLSECMKKKKNLVVGTTGWDHELPLAKKLTEESDIGVLYAPNFSLGVHLFLQILEYSAKLLSNFKEYDTALTEWHHNQKKDAPSGTAKEIAKRLENYLGKIPISSIRCGAIPGKHELIFDSPSDSITLTHEAKGRVGFARGALDAAAWLQGKKGFFTIDDYLRETCGLK